MEIRVIFKLEMCTVTYLMDRAILVVSPLIDGSVATSFVATGLQETGLRYV